MFHRVFTRWEDDLWLGVPWVAKRQDLSRDMPFVTLLVERPGEVCMTLPEGRVLCDYGPEHDHD